MTKYFRKTLTFVTGAEEKREMNFDMEFSAAFSPFSTSPKENANSAKNRLDAQILLELPRAAITNGL
jgi:hypothetical protein